MRSSLLLLRQFPRHHHCHHQQYLPLNSTKMSFTFVPPLPVRHHQQRQQHLIVTSPHQSPIIPLSPLPLSQDHHHFYMSSVFPSDNKSHQTTTTKATGTTTATQTTSSSSSKHKTSTEVRVRFAPSPTGDLHVGGARTALFNWLVARQTPNHNGRFIIRVEDTDLERSTLISEQNMLRDLEWLGLTWDEGPIKATTATTTRTATATNQSSSSVNNDGTNVTAVHTNGVGVCGPYRQSERAGIYKEYAERLLKLGKAYRCFCSEEELEQKRKLAEQQGLSVQYDGTWRDRSKKDIEKMLKQGKEFTIRYRIDEENDEENTITIQDKIRGEITWNANKTVGDFILLRSNGLPVYNFCVAIDDALMGITTVIRGEEHLTNTLRQILILKALDFNVPEYAHCSLILGGDGNKLSKRHGSTSIIQYKEKGYLPQAMLNYLATLGWNDGTEKEIFTKHELISKFSLNQITKSPAIFDETKLKWINKQHLKRLPFSQFTHLSISQLIKYGTIDSTVTSNSLLAHTITQLIQGSIDILSDAHETLCHTFTYPLEETLRTEEANKLLNEITGFKEISNALIHDFEQGHMPDGTAGEEHMTKWKKWVTELGKKFNRKGKALFHPIRLALTGKMQGPDVGLVLLLLHVIQGKTKHSLIPLKERIHILKNTLDRL